MVAGGLPDEILLEDINDILDFLEETGRTVRRDVWADECVAERALAISEARHQQTKSRFKF